MTKSDLSNEAQRAKVETRMTNECRNGNDETANRPPLGGGRFHHSGFEFDSSFEFQIS